MASPAGPFQGEFPGALFLFFFPGGALAFQFAFHEMSRLLKLRPQHLFLGQQLPPVTVEVLFPQGFFPARRFAERVLLAGEFLLQLLAQILSSAWRLASASAASRAS